MGFHEPFLTGTFPRVKLLIRGGSIAAGYGVKCSYVDIITQRYPQLDVINRSRIKDNSFQGIWTFNEDIDPFAADILMLHFGIDDAYQPVYRSEFKENLVQIVRLARKRFDPEILLLTSHPFDNQYEMEMIYIYYRVIREVAIDLSCKLIAVHSYWAGEMEEKGLHVHDYLQKDCRYPNEAGHELYAKAIITKIDNLMLKKQIQRR
jgi:lysophospholipase L1-like esterase